MGTADQALAPVLADAVDRKLAARLGTRTVAGRRCRDYRFVEPPAGPIKRLSGSDHDDLCIDDDGLVLREEYTLTGAVALMRQAVQVDIDPSGIDAELDTAGSAPIADPSAPSARAPQAGDRPSFFATPPAPAGYQSVSVVLFAFPEPNSQGQQLLYTSTVWSFARGPDLVTVEAGEGGGLPWVDTDPSRPVSLPIGAAKSVVRSDGAELRVDLGQGRWVRVRGTSSIADLTAYARRLRRPS